MLGIIKNDNRYLCLSDMVKSIYSNKLEDFVNLNHLLIPFRGIDSNGIILGTNIKLEDILNQNWIKTVFVGHTNKKLNELKDKYNFKIVEILKDKEFIKHNSFITAKGIIDYLNKDNKELMLKKILIVGYGNIGFYLAKLLKAYNSDFSILTFNELEMKYCYLENYKISRNLYDYDLIINTIPNNLDVDYSLLSNIRIIDVASSPYGFDLDLITKYKVSYLIYSNIPSKFAPIEGALVLKKIIDNHIFD